MSEHVGDGTPSAPPQLPPRPITPTDFQRVSAALRLLDDALSRESTVDVSRAGDEFRASLGGVDLPTTEDSISETDRIPLELKSRLRVVLRMILDVIHKGLKDSRRQDKTIVENFRLAIGNILTDPLLETRPSSAASTPAPVSGELQQLLDDLARRKRIEESRAPLIDACSVWVRAYDRDIVAFDTAMKQMWDYGCDWRRLPHPQAVFDARPWIPNLLTIGRLVRQRNWHDLIARGTAPDSPEWEALSYQLLRVAAGEGATEATVAAVLNALADAGKLTEISWQHPFNFLNVAIRERLNPDRAKAFPDLYPSPLPTKIVNDTSIEDRNPSPPSSPSDPTSSVNVEVLRTRCYPPVPLAELRPIRPVPPEGEIESAMKDVVSALTESPFGGPSPHLPADPSEHFLAHAAWLAFAEERGHGRPAAEWAIYRLVESDRLSVVWPSIEHPQPQRDAFEEAERLAKRLREQSERYRGGRVATVTSWNLFECGKVLQIRSTPRLWEWLSAGCPATNAKPIKPANPPTRSINGSELPVVESSDLEAKLGKLEPRVRVAYLQYEAVARDLGTPTDESAYQEAKERFSQQPVPALDTWVRYVRLARKELGEQKNQRRNRPAAVRSAVLPDGRPIED